MIKIIAEKLKMISFFYKKKIYPCTILKSEPCKIIYIKKNKKKRYRILIGYGETNKINKPLKGFFKKYNSKYYKYLFQFNNIKKKQIKNYIKKKEINLTYLKKNKYIDIISKSIGKGFQGVVKKYGFSGVGGKTHGQHNRLRSPGSIGAGSSPSRVFKGKKMGGRMGNIKKTIKNIKILNIDFKKKLLLVKGSIPGKQNIVIIKKKKK
ncbi:MAG: 50S ribosomal protein L3 [Candidatus Shikimatogenerans sp. JK-2022]|nr:50S ribosomal protein L3 [Candidatus Shikimatogenerans bostrichidophilus]